MKYKKEVKILFELIKDRKRSDKDMQSFVISLKRDEPLMLKPLPHSYTTKTEN